MRRILLVLLALTIAAGAAQAQPAPWEPERLSAGWTFTPSMVVGALWDSNVTVRAANEPHVEQWVGLLNPRGELDFNGRHTHMNAGYSGALNAYQDLPQLDRYEQRARFELRHQARPRLAFFSHVTGEIAPTTDRLELGPGVVPFVQVGTTVFDAQGGARYDASERTHIEGTYKFEDVHFERDVTVNRFLTGGYSNVGGVSVMRDLTQRFSAGGAYEYRHAVVAEGTQMFNVQSGGGQVSYQFDRNTTFHAGVGMTRLTSQLDGFTVSGPTLDGSIEREVRRVTLSAAVQHGYVPSMAFAGLTRSTTASGGVRVPLGNGRYYVTGRLAYGRTRPVEGFVGSAFELDSLWVQTSAGYSISRWLRAEGFYTGTHQTSTARGLVDRTRIGFQLITSKPLRIE